VRPAAGVQTTESVHRRLGEKTKPSSVKADTWSYKLLVIAIGETTKPPQDAEFNVVTYGAVGDR
jgi:hypothetical protein